MTVSELISASISVQYLENVQEVSQSLSEMKDERVWTKIKQNILRYLFAKPFASVTHPSPEAHTAAFPVTHSKRISHM